MRLFDLLKSTAGPYIHVSTRLRTVDFRHTLPQGHFGVEVSGHDIPTLDLLFRVFADKFHFPEYFGHNWGAFDDCLRDLEWLNATGFTLVITCAEELLRAEPVAAATLIKVLDKAGHEWAELIDLGEPWDRPPMPFQVFLLFSSDQLLSETLANWQADPGHFNRV